MLLKNIRRQTRRKYSAEEKIRIVLEGLRGEENISELCRREGIAASMYYGWSKEATSNSAGVVNRQAVPCCPFQSDGGAEMVGIEFTTTMEENLTFGNGDGTGAYRLKLAALLSETAPHLTLWQT